MTGGDHVPQFLNLSARLNPRSTTDDYCIQRLQRRSQSLLQQHFHLPGSVTATAAPSALATKIHAAATCGLAISTFGFRYIKSDNGYSCGGNYGYGVGIMISVSNIT
jgi:hypothetical protein